MLNYLVELININFFNPSQKPDKKVLEALANDCVREFSLYSYNEDGEERHYKIEDIEFIEDDWEKAKSEDRNLRLPAQSLISNEIREVLQKSERKKYLDGIKDIIFGAIWSTSPSGKSSSNNFLISAEEVTEQIARLIMMEDQIKQESWPKILSYYMEIYKLGVWPIGVVGTKDENKNYILKFAVFIPPVGKGAKHSLKTMPFYERLWHVNKDFAQALGKSESSKNPYP